MRSSTPRGWFSHPENDTRTRSAWERFLSGAGLPPRALRCVIDDSWRRCLSGQVDPLQKQAAPPLEQAQLAALRKRHERLVSVSTPLIAQARDFLSQTGTVMILTDPEGTILSLEGDPRIREPLGDIRLLPGSKWTESACGTNAIGTALALGQPVQIHAAEHFCTGIKQWTCSATVIRDPLDFRVLGAIDVSGLSRSYSRHSLALAVSIADRIESQLGRLDLERRYRLLERCMSRFALAGADGVIAFDRRGNLVKASGSAQAALAALGIRFELNSTSQIPGLSTEQEVFGRIGLPEWLRPDWVEPIREGRDFLGTLVRIPGVRSHSAPCLDVRLDTAPARTGFERIVGNSPALHEALQKARRLARSQVPVVLLGETGVGKELFARGIHDEGGNPDRPFVALNCGGFSRELLASELFGYAEGAFTGARRGGMIGKIEAANGGTLFLDEIGEMPLDLQPHFLRVLEEAEIFKLGETTPRKVSFRLIAATNRDLRAEVSDGRFRMDLFYRIAVTNIHIPALRERREDIRPLVQSMLDSFSLRNAGSERNFEEAAYAALERYDWPGNVRELRNVIDGVLLMAMQEQISVADLPHEILGDTAIAHCTSAPQVGTLENAELAQIRSAVQSSQGNLTLAARSLGISKSTLYLKLKKHGMEDVRREARIGGSAGR